MVEKRFEICGYGASLPARRLGNEELASGLSVDENWIDQRCGIQSRFVAEDETTRTLGTAAARKAVTMAAGVRPDFVICSTFTPEYLLCPTAPAIAHDLGLHKPGAIDLNAACSGGILGILTSLAYVFSGAARAVLLVSADTTTKYLDKADAQTRILFGDGAAALLLRAAPSGGTRVLSYAYGSDGAGAQFFHLGLDPECGAECTNGRGRLFVCRSGVKMDGRALFRFAVEQGHCLLSRLCGDAGVARGDIGRVIVHQANYRIIEALQERTGIPASRWTVNVGRVGNMAAASMPLALVDALENNELRNGDLVLCAGFGAGLTWAGMLVEW
jgi:3-oxoacyl-[acyl-carrier-protein] synthase-3